ncbi:hypothetical protein Dip510_001345 [Elusimicrobium posterum]|uniref:hypothetical protein n=1 Tax=Elusimicrobium posterum TaxID=3116653 RepID=UPI003C728246
MKKYQKLLIIAAVILVPLISYISLYVTPQNSFIKKIGGSYEPGTVEFFDRVVIPGIKSGSEISKVYQNVSTKTCDFAPIKIGPKQYLGCEFTFPAQLNSPLVNALGYGTPPREFGNSGYISKLEVRAFYVLNNNPEVLSAPNHAKTFSVVFSIGRYLEGQFRWGEYPGRYCLMGMCFDNSEVWIDYALDSNNRPVVDVDFKDYNFGRSKYWYD